MNKFEKDFIYYTNLIESYNNFAYARYADGEVALMKGVGVGTNTQAFQVDKWNAPNTLTPVGEELIETLKHTEGNYHYAISAHSDSESDYQFLTQYIDNTNITFANLWINSNYQKMNEFYKNLKKEVFLICNFRAKKENYPFKVNEIFPFPDDCINYWNQYGEEYLSELLEYIAQVENQTFFISAGPISEILIHKMFSTNPNNQYIDVGSSLDEFTHGRITRPYMDMNSPYSKEISEFLKIVK